MQLNRDSNEVLSKPPPGVVGAPSDFDYRELLETLLIVPWEANPDEQRFSYVGPQAESLLGFPLSMWYEKDFWASQIHPDDREAVIEFCLEQTKQNRDHTFEYRMIRADGRVIWILDIVRVHRRGDPTLVRGLLLDITDRKRIETALQRSEARLNACVQHPPHVAIQWYDRAGRVVLWNEASSRMFGFSEAEALGSTLDQLIHTPEEAREFFSVFEEITRTGKPAGPTEYHFRRRDGSDAVCLSTTFGIPSPSGEPWFVSMDVDITDRKRLEEQIRQTQKVESLGVLAGGVAHDFNNLLTSILGFASLVEMEMPAESNAREAIGQIISAGQKAAELTQQLLAYAGKGQFLLQPVNLSWLIKEISRLMQSGVKKKARIELKLQDDLPLIEGDPTQLKQMVMSLVVNASDSLREREGLIEIATGVTKIDAAQLATLQTSSEVKPGQFVFVAITDNGQGMDEKTLSQIFDPFFSTKFTGRGLGLAAAQGIVRSHRGLIEVRSMPGEGSTFRALLPTILTPSEDPTKKPQNRNWSGTGTILLIDDEAAIRSLARLALRRAGFDVEEALDGQEGIEIFERKPQGFVAVLLDLIMPRKDGAEALKAIRQLNPTIPVFLMSGYTEEKINHLLDRGEVSAFLHKPFSAGKLIETLRAVLM